MDQTLRDKLKKFRWTDAPPNGHVYQMSPPPSLFENMPKQFDVYEAELIQELLRDPVPEEPASY
jgi:hypothetical protein